MTLFTVFTPSYNRAATLHRVYDSLRVQTFRDFEWLIVDDGSSDNTAEVVAAWQAEANFPLRYIQQPNSGKHTAFNHGVRMAHGELFLSLDSDDACIPTALERFKFHWDSIPPDQKPRYSAVTGLCVTPAGNIVGDKFPTDICDSNTLEMKYKYKVRGEKWGFQRLEVLRRFPFPEVPGLKHCTETVVWSAIAREYTTRYVNEALRIYYPGADPAQQVSGMGAKRLAAPGFIEHTVALNDELDWFPYAPLRFIRSGVHFVRFGLHSGKSYVQQWRALHRPGGKLLWLLGLVPGSFIYMREKH